jgi:hypothetical protein
MASQRLPIPGKYSVRNLQRIKTHRAMAKERSRTNESNPETALNIYIAHPDPYIDMKPCRL